MAEEGALLECITRMHYSKGGIIDRLEQPFGERVQPSIACCLHKYHRLPDIGNHLSNCSIEIPVAKLNASQVQFLRRWFLSASRDAPADPCSCWSHLKEESRAGDPELSRRRGLDSGAKSWQRFAAIISLEITLDELPGNSRRRCRPRFRDGIARERSYFSVLIVLHCSSCGFLTGYTRTSKRLQVSEQDPRG